MQSFHHTTLRWVIPFFLLFITLVGCFIPPSPTPASLSSPNPTLPPALTPSATYLPDLGGDDDSSLPTPMSPTPTAPPSSGATPLPPPVPKPDCGVQLHLMVEDKAEVLDWARGLGIGWVKQQVEWHTIEHGPDNFEWRHLDRIVEACDAFGFKLLLSVVHAPDWTRASELESGPPTDYAEFGRFMAQLATRYRGRVAAYELWNEPNLAREWRGDTLDPARFVMLVAEGAEGVQSADPEALVISGAPAVTGINDGVEAIDDRVYLRGMIEASITQLVDGIGAHPYGFANPPTESWQDSTHIASGYNDHPSFFFRDTLEDYRRILLNSDADKFPIWVTEFGWPSADKMGQMDTTGWEYAREVSEAQQADYISQAFRMGGKREWVGPMFLWNLNLAVIWGSENPVSAYSLLRPDASYRPAYITLRLMKPREP